jgi:signal transduction histidine kinase
MFQMHIAYIAKRKKPMDKNDDLKLASPEFYNFPPEAVLEMFTHELRHSTASLSGCVQLLEKIVLPEVDSSKQTLERVIQIIHGHVDHIEALRQDNYLYLEKRKKT